jgi:hypothetical protein
MFNIPSSQRRAICPYPNPVHALPPNSFTLQSDLTKQIIPAVPPCWTVGLYRPSPHSRYRTTTLPPALQVDVKFKQSRRGAQSYPRSDGEDALKLMRTNRASAQVELRTAGQQHIGRMRGAAKNGDW